MKRGFLNDARYKRAIDGVYASSGPELARQGKRISPGGAPDNCGGDGAGGRDKTDVETKGEENGSQEGRVQNLDSESCDGVDCAKTEDETPTEAKDVKGKGKEKVVDVDDEGDLPANFLYASGTANAIPSRPAPRRPGWGRDPEEAFFHRVPESIGDHGVKRAIFCIWPRNPNGELLRPVTQKTKGKTSPDGYPWFATLYDVFWVNRLPKVPNFISVTTGSMISAVLKDMGELDAVTEMEWAETEGEPRVEGAADTAELIRCMDMRSRLAARYNLSVYEKEVHEKDNGKTYESDDANGEDRDSKKDHEQVTSDANDVLPAYIPPPPKIPVTSPFHPSHYPKLWPLTPFEKTFPVLLQEHIPLYLLPKTLYVHDPFGLLTVCEREFCDTSWTSRPDIVWTYNINFSDPVRSQIEEARRKAEEMEEFKARTLIILRYQRTEEQIKSYEPIIEIPLPPYIRRPTSVEESHLYLSPHARVGHGHHSVVYKGEWELPRDIFMKPTICPVCFKDSADKEIQRLKDTGRWEKMLRAASWGPRGYTGRPPLQADLDAVRDPPKLVSDGEIIEREMTCVVPPGTAPSKAVELIEELNIWDVFKSKNGAISMLVPFVPDPAKDSEAAIAIRINPPCAYKSPQGCIHDVPGREGPVPRTAKFAAVAKLSIEDDPHLAREANNYQTFPEHLFDHYNGYIIISQLKSIVPVNAVLPQFYGYYVPKRGEQRKGGEPSYLSPILLLEHCGTPIEPQELSLEDQEECASLLLRFQRAGWLHESVAPRNFLVQYGKPTEFPLMRRANPEPSFRLIDFGRSRKYTTTREKEAEELDAIRMFEKLQGNMAVTLYSAL